MINPLVSIIIPFYNPEKYFNELLKSISNQSYKNIEVVLVDDGSDSIYNDTAKRFLSEAKNRILITKKNGGVALARQAGIDASTGEFIIHADADDFLPEFAIEQLVKSMLASKADVVIGGYIVKYKNKEHYVGVNKEETYWGFVEGLLLGKYHGALWNKLIKRSLYKSVVFEPDINYMEDKLVLAKILRFGPYSISYLDQPVYVYRQNSDSVTYNLSMSSIRSSVTVANKIAELYNGILDDKLINTMVDRQRISEIFQSAKKGLNVFYNDDIYLVESYNISFRVRLVLWLARKNLVFVISFLSKLNSLLAQLLK